MDTSVHFDPDLIRRYDLHGPRYTSYPTAAQFRDGFDPMEYAQAARSSNDDPIPAPLSLYLHIPFCESPCYYCGCTRVITRNHAKAQAYLARLYREIELQAALFDRDRSVRQLHLGGGTPTFLTLDELQELMDVLGRFFTLSRNPRRDFSIEVDPRTVQPETIAGLATLGFNRISFGIQDLNPDVQQAVNRIQPQAHTLDLIATARHSGFASINADLIYGLPYQTLHTFGETLETIIAARPDRLAIYNYAHMPQLFKAQRQIAEDRLPDAEAKLGLLGLTIGKLTAAGYEYIGMDHFALPTDPLADALHRGTLQRNFQGYATGAECDLVGFGMSAIGFIRDTYSQNAKSLREYSECLDDGRLAIRRGLEMNADDRLRRALLQQLTCQGQITFSLYEQHFGISFQEYFATELRALTPMAADGLVKMSAAGCVLTPTGRLLVRAVAMVFDAYLRRHTSAPARFSKVI
ncbi:MAG: oxygen-independent coproporphyrinogen III oxidase [Gammaproteobacteria bacterium]|nr:oxygen-independent coproporphyrinogen III oxidase [Gammaproteobacteria bacterium]